MNNIDTTRKEWETVEFTTAKWCVQYELKTKALR